MKKILLFTTLVSFFFAQANAQSLKKSEKAALQSIQKIISKAGINKDYITKYHKKNRELIEEYGPFIGLPIAEPVSKLSSVGVLNENKLNTKLILECLLAKYDLNNSKNDTTTTFHKLVKLVVELDKIQKSNSTSSDPSYSIYNRADLDREVFMIYEFILGTALYKENDIKSKKKMAEAREKRQLALKKEQERKENEIIYVIVEKMPKFPGGDQVLRKFIQENVKDPNPNDELSCTVYVRFVVERTGIVQKAQIAKGVNEEYDNEALRVVESLPKWTPGVQGGKTVNVWYTVSVRF